MKKYAIVMVGLLVLASCQRIDDIGEATAVPTSTPHLLNTVETAVPTSRSTAVPPTAYSSPTIPTSTSTVNVVKTPQPTPTQHAIPTPSLPPFAWESAYNVFTQDTYDFSLRYPPGWTAVALPKGVSLIHIESNAALRIRIGHKSAAPVVRSGVSVGDLFPRGPISFLGQPLPSSVLIYQSRNKAILYNGADKITRDDWIFIISLESNRSHYESIDIPIEVQIDADRIIASIAWGEMPAPPPPVINQSDGDSFQPRISADGQTITFLSTGLLTVNDDNDAVSVFVRDRISQTTTLVNVGWDEYMTQQSAHGAAMSANGRVIAYYSFEGDLVPGDEMDCGSETQPMSCGDLFIHDRDTGLTERIPLGRVTGVGADYTLALSGDGRFVAYGSAIYDRETGQTETIPTIDEQPLNGYTFAPQFAANGDLAFVSVANNLDTGTYRGVFDLFVWERQVGRIVRISAGNANSGMSSTGEGYWGEMGISGDGRFIAYASTASNLTDDSVNECEDWRGHTRTCHNIFLHGRETGQTRLITPNSDGDSFGPALSADSSFLTFVSIATNLTDDGLTCDFPTIINCGQVYLHDTQTGQTMLISRTADGVPGGGGQLSTSYFGRRPFHRLHLQRRQPHPR